MARRRDQAQPRREFDAFVADVVDGLLRSASLITWDFAEAEDLVQECLFQVARRWPRIKKMEQPVAYARTVLVHLALDEGKRRSRRRSELRPEASGFLEAHDDDGAVRVLGRVEANADLLDVLRALPPRQRAALVLRYFDDLSEAEAAAVMGCSVGTVKSTTSRALERLRKELEGREAASGPAANGRLAHGTYGSRGTDGSSPGADFRTAALTGAQPDMHAVTTDTRHPTEGSTSR
jgi:RNA polymerase sigma-70 factor (sigma-E family)